ncbi:type VI secretion system baseplate subunit TssG [Aquimarina sp. I32.4]|uniref:type VI secretion system baseplate subunit TssG n=1 Tax=Aquimarina sp. I32.4 TaxID=2053903 RepID=UPI000CDEA340|nr:type VI secretion system baseplate subunit TssG [Aquimarina sp. I32.4]
MQEKHTQEIYDELITAYRSLKAEVFVAEIFENSNLDFSDIDIFNKSTFSRSYRRDVTSFKLDTYSAVKDKLRFNLARNGIYDMLPEAFFHEQVKKGKYSYRGLRKKHKEEEQDARAFFAPIENEFFVQKVRVEENERELIDEFINLKNDFLLDFWGLDKEMPINYSLKLLKLLPFAHKISGNPELTALSLEKIIGEKVRVVKKHESYTHKDATESTNTLGVDFVLELNDSRVLYPYFEIEIGPIERKNMRKFLQNGVAKKIISTFCDYFIPLEIEIKLNITYSKQESVFVLDESNNPRLGLTTMI